MNPRILIVVNAEWYFWSHRLGLAKQLQSQGFEVTVAAAVERNYRQRIEAEGLRFVPLKLRRRSINVFRELASVWELWRVYRREQPDLIHHVTVKPVLYGSWAAKLAHVPAVVNAIPGLGYLFLGKDLRRRVVRQIASTAYRIALTGQNTRVIFQNPDDRALFVARRLVPIERTVLIRGSGVNIDRFIPTPLPPGKPIILLASRLLWDKGLSEFVEASRLLQQAQTVCRVVIVGVPDFENPNSVSTSMLRRWQAERVIEWWGLQEDMPEVLSQASIVVLPTSYSEGVPKILLEAAAAGRPIVATNVPGCREIVRPGENGLLVPPRDPVALAEALHTLLADPARLAAMGNKGREIAVAEFSEETVIKQTLAVYKELLPKKWPD